MNKNVYLPLNQYNRNWWGNNFISFFVFKFFFSYTYKTLQIILSINVGLPRENFYQHYLLCKITADNGGSTWGYLNYFEKLEVGLYVLDVCHGSLVFMVFICSSSKLIFVFPVLCCKNLDKYFTKVISSWFLSLNWNWWQINGQK